MKTAVLDSGFAGSSQQTIPLVLEPARKTRRAVTREARAGQSGQTRKPRRVVVPFSTSRSELEAPDARIESPESGIWGLLELGFVMVLFASVFLLVFLSVAPVGNL
ncbi:MAG: hypothetical protein JO170_26450 [Verrucomicrobia bacterium]|nr:hypothetical protein [Verrucomicrobiota bacterium]